MTQALPEFLESLKKRAAEWAALAPADLVEAVISEYTEGSPIGWHRDVPKFETIVGISLNSSCRMRFKPYKGEGRIVSVNARASIRLSATRSGKVELSTQYSRRSSVALLHYVSNSQHEAATELSSFFGGPSRVLDCPSGHRKK